MNLLAHIDELGASPEAAAFRTLTMRMRSAAEIEPSPGLTGRIMSAVDRDAKEPQRPLREPRTPGMKPWFGAAAAAAAVLALFVFRSAFLAQMGVGGATGGAAQESTQWLARCQEQDGSWNPARYGGAKSYQPALTALSALALHREGARYAVEVRRARAYLAAIQRSDGSFGGQGRERFYNQALATYALAETAAAGGELEPLRRAAGAIIDSQSVQGGWDYEGDSEGNAAITAWQIEALAAAGAAGVPDVDLSVRKGLRWLRGMADAGGRVSYNRGAAGASETVSALTAHTLLTAGAAFPELSATGRRVVAALGSGASGGDDLYRDCMKVRAFDAAGATDAAGVLRRSIASARGDAASDQWGKVGGRLYMESLRSLARAL